MCFAQNFVITKNDWLSHETVTHLPSFIYLIHVSHWLLQSWPPPRAGRGVPQRLICGSGFSLWARLPPHRLHTIIRHTHSPHTAQRSALYVRLSKIYKSSLWKKKRTFSSTADHRSGVFPSGWPLQLSPPVSPRFPSLSSRNPRSSHSCPHLLTEQLGKTCYRQIKRRA